MPLCGAPVETNRERQKETEREKNCVNQSVAKLN